MDNRVYEHHVIFVGDQWVVKPAHQAILARFDTQQEAIDVGYKLALEAGDELLIFDEDGALVNRIDPEDNLPLSPETEAILEAAERGELEMIPFEQAFEEIENDATTIPDQP